jgi:hypothetical protein
VETGKAYTACMKDTPHVPLILLPFFFLSNQEALLWSRSKQFINAARQEGDASAGIGRGLSNSQRHLELSTQAHVL